MSLSYLIITYNRCEGLLSNLGEVFKRDPDADVWVVDNASTDGVGDALRQLYPQVRLIRVDRNLGMPARNIALRQMRCEYVAIIDDDSYPTGDAIRSSIDYMGQHPEVAAVVGRAVLPDGRSEASAFPSILLGCASCVRLSAVREVGYFPDDFFRQAEEYDLSCRLWNAGYRIVRFEDLIYRHDKKPSPSRASQDVAALDLKHNLIIAARYLPQQVYASYREDFIQRYGAIMRHAGYEADIEAVIADADRHVVDASRLRRQPLGDQAFEAIFDHGRQREIVARWAKQNDIHRVAIADFSKNLFATYSAAALSGLEICSLIDDREAFHGLTYRGVPLVKAGDVKTGEVDGIIVSNINPAQVAQVASGIQKRFPTIETLTLWQGTHLREPAVEELAA